MKTNHLLSILAAVLLAGCDKPQPKAKVEPTKTNEDMFDRLAEQLKNETPNQNLERRIKYLEGQLADEQAQMGMVIQNMQVIASDYATRAYHLNTEQKNFVMVTSNMGPVMVATESVTPYLDGYTVSLKVGNPWYMVYNDITVKASWPQAGTTNVLSKEFPITKQLRAGAWTKVDITVTPAQVADLKECWFSFQFKTISLNGSAL